MYASSGGAFTALASGYNGKQTSQSAANLDFLLMDNNSVAWPVSVTSTTMNEHGQNQQLENGGINHGNGPALVSIK